MALSLSEPSTCEYVLKVRQNFVILLIRLLTILVPIVIRILLLSVIFMLQVESPIICPLLERMDEYGLFQVDE